MARRKSNGASPTKASAKSAAAMPATDAISNSLPDTTARDIADVEDESARRAPSSVQRYKESRRRIAQKNGASGSGKLGSIAAGPGGLFVTPEDVDALEDEQANVEGLDEPTLGQRLRSVRAITDVNNGDEDQDEDDESDDDEDVDEDDDDDDDDEDDDNGKRSNRRAAKLTAGSLSLGETLTQALHSDDKALLSSCLAHYDPTVIRLSVSRLSGPLALRLLEHCVDRMSYGGRKSAGQLDSARARGIVEWIRATLTAHTGYLMSVPALVSRLAQLHATLTARLASHERLLALNGRLELVLSQIEMRNAYASQQAVRVQGVKSKNVHQANANRTAKGKKMANGRAQQQNNREWVETSSDEEDEEENDARMDVDESSDAEDDEADADDVEVVRADDDGQVEDVALGQNVRRGATYQEESDEEEDDVDDEEEEDEDEEDDDEEDDDDEKDGDYNGLLDLEAESTDGDEDEDEEEESD